MIRIGICDDDRVYADRLNDIFSEILKSKEIDAEAFYFTDPKELLAKHEKEHFDVLFLDIDMPEISGFDISRTVREASHTTYIIFISAKNELVYNSFEYNPFYFICKTNEDELYLEIDHVIDKLLLHYQQYRIITVNDSVKGITTLRLRDVLYIMSNKHYLYYYVDGIKEPYIERSTLKEKENEINCSEFVKTHQRYFVNMNHIERLRGLINALLLDDGTQIPISRKYNDSVTQAYIVFKRR